MSCEVRLPPPADTGGWLNTSRSNIKHPNLINGVAPADSNTLIITSRSNIRQGIMMVGDLLNNLSPMNEAGKAAFGKTLESGIVVGGASNSISGTINGFGIEKPGVK